jgi:single-strand DNA-binding protein
MQIYLNGKIQLEQWQDKNSGENRSKTTMVIEGFDFVSGQSNGQASGQNQPQSQPQQGYQQPQQPAYQNNQQSQQPIRGNQGRPQKSPAYAPTDFEDDDVPISRKATSPELFLLV